MKYGLEFAGARRVRRTWRGTVLTVLTLLTVSALAGWLLHLVRRAATRGDVMPRLPGVAMWPMSSVLVWGVVALCVALLAGMALAGWRELTPREGVAQGAEGREQGEAQAGKPMLPESDPLATTSLVFEIMPASISRMDVACICLALASEARLIRDMVREAQRSLSVEDYGEGLAAAERRLGELRTRLWQLKAHFDGGLISAADENDLPKSYGEAARNANAGGVS